MKSNKYIKFVDFSLKAVQSSRLNVYSLYSYVVELNNQYLEINLKYIRFIELCLLILILNLKCVSPILVSIPNVFISSINFQFLFY